ncbi:hypothetical protein HDU93_006198 [Gonapodya sp. JEL0774]|nr:hypothetical protein HDU93_006198 [Gonapodya sp. JEL0774]
MAIGFWLPRHHRVRLALNRRLHSIFQKQKYPGEDRIARLAFPIVKQSRNFWHAIELAVEDVVIPTRKQYLNPRDLMLVWDYIEEFFEYRGSQAPGFLIEETIDRLVSITNARGVDYGSAIMRIFKDWYSPSAYLDWQLFRLATGQMSVQSGKLTTVLMLVDECQSNDQANYVFLFFRPSVMNSKHWGSQRLVNILERIYLRSTGRSCSEDGIYIVR